MIDIFYFDNGVKRCELSELSSILNSNNKIWVDIVDISSDEKEIIQKAFDLHPLTSEDLFNLGTRVKVEEFSKYIFSVFYTIKSTNSIELSELDFVLGKNFLITNHRKKVDSFEIIKKNSDKLDKLFVKGVDFLFHKLLDVEVDNFFPVLEGIDDIIEKLEEEVIRNPKPELLTKILKLKRKIVSLKKVTLPQREKISFLAKNNYEFIGKKAIPYFRDIYDHAIRVSDIIDNYREAIGGTSDAYMAAISNRMNEVMKTLSIIATIALPLGIISGIFGTNFDILPGQHIHYGFWIMIFLMLFFVVGMLVYFKKKRWF
jgi:magnesium transporter